MNNKPWQDMYPATIPTSLEYTEKPLHSFLKQSAEEFSRQTAISFEGKEMTYKELYESALKFATYLQMIGIEKGDRVAIMLPNCPQAVIGFFGTLIAGGIVVQTNPLYTERELEYQLNDSGAKFILTLDILFPRVSNCKKNGSKTYHYNRHQRLFTLSQKSYLSIYSKKTIWTCS